jgi:hypothetical protein
MAVPTRTNDFSDYLSSPEVEVLRRSRLKQLAEVPHLVGLGFIPR